MIASTCSQLYLHLYTIQQIFITSLSLKIALPSICLFLLTTSQASKLLTHLLQRTKITTALARKLATMHFNTLLLTLFLGIFLEAITIIGSPITSAPVSPITVLQSRDTVSSITYWTSRRQTNLPETPSTLPCPRFWGGLGRRCLHGIWCTRP